MPNGEGYPDPTADLAISHVYKEQMKKKKKGGKQSGNRTKTEKSNTNRQHPGQ